ncbi:MAG: trypsin-like peptidase domain-containing protein [Ruminococcus sp.]|nr:trypsin-like peptidase domain-containing protein [Ruminococcus sp.]
MDENIIADDGEFQKNNENNIDPENASEPCINSTPEDNSDALPENEAEALPKASDCTEHRSVDNTAYGNVQYEPPASQQPQKIRNPYIQSDQYNQYTQFRQYHQQFQQNPYQQQYQQYQSQQTVIQPAVKKTIPLTDGQKKIATLLRIGIVLIALIFIYCIISDVFEYRHFRSEYNYSSGEYSDNVSDENNSGDNAIIYREGKPANSNVEKGSVTDGKYTVEELAASVSPSIVQISAADANGTVGSTGSGIILSENGYILTNAHVVSGFDSFEITVYNNDDPYKAKLIGYDSKSDLAVMQIKANDLIPATIGYSEELSVGEEVVAIGNPAGLTSSVTKGIVSALGRQIRSGSTGFYMDCIQTDAAISPGNSGGALVNMYGQVVGVTSSKYASAYYSGSAYEGLGFAISIDQAMPIAEELINQGYISGRVRIGITFTSLTAEAAQTEFAANFNITDSPCKEGLWISAIDPKCDIAKSELSVNDIILSVNGQKVNDYDDLSAIIMEHKADDELTATCRRYTFGDEKGTLKHKDFTIKFKLMEDTSGDY